MKKNINKFIICTLLSTFILSNNVYAYTKENISISINSMLQPISSNIINKEGYILVAFRDLFEMLNIKVDWNSVTRNITAKKDNKELIINIDSSKTTLNDINIDMPISVEILNDTVYVPLRFVCELFDMTVDWNEEKQKISIDTKKEGYIYLDDLYQDENIKTLSQEEAVKLAQAKNSNIKNLNDALEYNKELYSDLHKQLIGENLYDPSINPILQNIDNLDALIEDKDINQKIIEDNIELSVISIATNIKSTKLNIAVLEQTINLGQKNIDSLELKYKYGMISEIELNKAKDMQKNNKLNLESLKNSLKTQQKALNNILGENFDVNVDIKLNDDFNEIDKINIDSFITRNKEGDISIQLLKKNLERTEQGKAYNSGSDTKKYNDIKMAQRKLEDAKIDIENKIRNNYNNLLKLRDRDKSLKLELDKAIEDYNKISANYINGNATLNQVDQARLSILNTEKEIEQNKINYSIALYTFQKPYLSSNLSFQ